MVSPTRGLTSRICTICGAEFQPYRSNQLTCSRTCYDQVPERKAARRSADRHGKRTRLADPESRERANARNRIANKPHRKLAYLKQKLRSTYGLDYDQYLALIERQSNRCAICGDEPDPNGRGPYARLQVDHDHDTGKVRALLCASCNKALGHLKDDPARVASALRYLTEHKG